MSEVTRDDPASREPVGSGDRPGPAEAVAASPAGSPQLDPRTVSVVICTKDRPDDARRAVESIRASDAIGRGAEIVVVEEADRAREIEGVRYVHLARDGLGFGHARNVGVRNAGGDIILFIDDDCVAMEGWAQALSAPLSDDPVLLGVAGSVHVRDCGVLGLAENILGFPGGGLRYLHGSAGRTVPTRYLSTCNCAYRRRAIEEAGGFPEDASAGGEDYLLARRVVDNGPCVYVPDAGVYHRPRDSFGAIFRWFVRRGRSEPTILARSDRRGRLVLDLLRSSWSLRLALAAAVLSAWPALLAWAPVVLLAYYLALLWRYRFALRYPSHRRAWWIVPLVKVTMDLGTELGRWQAFLTGSRR